MPGYQWVQSCPVCPHPLIQHRPELVTNGVEDVLSLECPTCERTEELRDDYDPQVHQVPSCAEITLTGNRLVTTKDTRTQALSRDLAMFGKNALGEERTPKNE